MTDHALLRQGKSGLLAALLLMCLLILLASTSGGNTAGEDVQSAFQGADVLALQIFEPGEEHRMPPAVFAHDRHTRTLKDKDCSACHAKADSGAQALTFSFKDTKDLVGQAAMERYHDECIGCHKQQADKSKKSGPLVENCRGCHQPPQTVAPDRKLIEFDHSLHFKHQSAEPIKYQPEESDKNCGACHHVYDEKTEKLVYEKGAEGSCRYCHKEQRVDDTRTFRNAAHDDCVNCHRRFKEKEAKAGPVECQGCHSADSLAEIEQIEDVPRLERGQPDAKILADWLKAAEEAGEMPSQLTAAVAFDHLQHEKVSGTCRRCHHKSLEACSECHKSQGAEDGDFVSLERSMHLPDSSRSCIGCHQMQKAVSDCAGCHAQMPEKPFAARDCGSCHALDAEMFKPLPLDEDAKKAIAESAVKKRPDRIETVAKEKIPEEVEIDVMVDQYQAAKMPHRKIVLSLIEKIGANSLAAVFHTRAETLCSGCHHNSPASLNPPKCASCHTAKEGRLETDRPGLKAAYHGQCIECHEQMGVEKPAATDCKSCHEKRNES